jgi:hypothetical protein
LKILDEILFKTVVAAFKKPPVILKSNTVTRVADPHSFHPDPDPAF